MQRVFLTARPRDPATGAEVEVRLGAGSGSLRHPVTHEQHRAGLSGLPLRRAAMQLEAEGWSGRIVPTFGELTFATADQALTQQLLRLFWADAPVTVELAEASDDTVVWMRGAITGMSFGGGVFAFGLTDTSRVLDKPVATDVFEGTGGLDGYAGAAGRPKRRSWGIVRNIEAQLLDPAYNIYEIGDPAHALTAIDVVRDKGREGTLTVLGPQASAAATLEALRIVPVPQGGAVVAPSISCVRWWTQPVGPLTADVEGAAIPSIPHIVNALLVEAGHTPLPANAINDAYLFQPGVAGLHVGDALETWALALDRLCLGVSLVLKVDAAGIPRLSQVAFSGDAPILKASFLARDGVLPPTTTRTLIARRNHRVHQAAEVSSALEETLERIGSDLWLARSEKPGLLRDYRTMIDTKAAAYARATELGVAEAERQAADTALSQLDAWLGPLVPSWSDGSVDTPLPDAQLADLFRAASAATAALQAAITSMGGTPGPTGEAAPGLELPTASLRFTADTSGTVKAGQLPKTLKATFFRGSADVSSVTTWALSGTAATGSIDESGLVTLTQVGDGTLTVSGTHNGVALTKDVAITLDRDAPPAPQAGVTQTITTVTASNAAVPSGTPTSGVVTVQSSANGTLKLSGYVSYYAVMDGPQRMWVGRAHVLVRTGGSAWAVAASIDGETAISRSGLEYASEPGWISIGSVLEGLAANTSYDVALEVFKASGNGSVASVDGSVTVSQS